MPRMVYVKGVGHVRAGSWGTKPVHEQWRMTRKQLRDASLVLIRRLDHLLFKDGSRSEYSRAIAEADEQDIIWELEDLRDQIECLLAKFPKARRLKALENVTGRTPEEAAAFRAKADALRKSL